MILSLYTRLHILLSGVRGRMTDENGAVATEYALLLVLIALAIVTAATALGTAIAGKFSDACTKLGGAGC
jgi:pilus assembly protein Flp/PilA